jgi:16S rRNA (cytosine1402-N4)-methyltransferase
VTFHSLEDRIVKQFFATRSGRTAQGSRHMPSPEASAAPSFTLTTRGAVRPSDAEIHANPRARSAKLRVGARTEAAPPPPLAAIEALAALPERTMKGRGGRR